MLDALKNVPAELRSKVESASDQQLSAAWTEELTKGGQFSHAQRSIITTEPRAITHAMGMSVATGGAGRLGFLTKPYEFGTLNREQQHTYTRRSPKGARHEVTRRTRRQLPTRSQTGWIGYPAAGRFSKRAFGMYLQIVVKVVRDSIDGGR